MTSQVSKCHKFLRGIVPLYAAIVGPDILASSSTSALQNSSTTRSCKSTSSAISSLMHLCIDSNFSDPKQKINIAFAVATNKTVTTLWLVRRFRMVRVLSTVTAAWNKPSSALISSTLLETSYQCTMDRVFLSHKQHGSETVSINGAINVISKSTVFFVGHTSTPLFIDYLPADMEREIIPNVIAKW